MTVTKNKIIIGTRGSKLALWQANWIKDKLERLYPDLVIAIEKIKTTGDKITDVPLSRIGGKGLFVKEIEEALFKSRIDIAVHSMKDVPAELPEGLHIAAICERENPRDAIISNNNKSLKELPDGAVLGTSSLRRTVQLKAIRTDFNIKPLRGNVDTRINKLKNGDFDAIILAMAGIKRMGLENLITEVISEDTMIPAIGQGAIGIETRVDDEFINEIIKPLNHEDTAICVLAERAFLSIMGGGCQVPLACHAKILKQNNKTTINIEGILGDPDGKWSIIRGSRNGSLSQANILAEDLARELLDKGGNPKLLVE